MKRRTFFNTAGKAMAGITVVWWLTAGAALAALTAESRTRHPNILFIITDQQFAAALSCVGNPFVKTPAMYGLAKRGMMFTEAYCTSPVCSPSRASMFTGLFPHQHGVPVNGKRIQADLKEIWVPGGADPKPGQAWKSAWGRMLRTARFKYSVYDRGKDREQLHDMQNDRGEMHNLAVDPSYRDVLSEHRRRLAAWCNETDDAEFIPHLVSP